MLPSKWDTSNLIWKQALTLFPSFAFLFLFFHWEGPVLCLALVRWWLWLASALAGFNCCPAQQTRDHHLFPVHTPPPLVFASDRIAFSLYHH
jgi:hypothetical protein